MQVTDPDGVAASGEVDLVESVIENFRDASGRVGVCVPEVQIVPEGDPHLSEFVGAYTSPHQPIYVQTGLGDLDRVTRHELCHALDQLEALHDGEAVLFPPGSVTQSLYDTDELRTGEAFARACAEGARGAGLRRTVFGACGIEPDTASNQFVLDNVYPDAGYDFSSQDVSIERYSDEEGLPLGAVAVARALSGSHAFVLGEFLESDYTTYSSDPALFEIDLATGGLLAEIDIPVDHHDNQVDWSIFTEGDDVIVVESRDEGTGWSINLDEGTASRIDAFPIPGGRTSFAGVIGGGRTLWYSDISGAQAPTLREFDLSSGTGSEIAWPDELEGWDSEVYGWVDSDGALLGASYRRGILARDVESGTWEVVAGLDSTELRGSSLDPTGQVIAAVTLSTLDQVDADVDTLVIYDTSAGIWSIPTDPCGAASTAGPFPLTNGDDAWIWDWGPVEGIYSGKYFGHVVVGE